jgi:hypothetical protein
VVVLLTAVHAELHCWRAASNFIDKLIYIRDQPYELHCYSFIALLSLSLPLSLSLVLFLANIFFEDVVDEHLKAVAAAAAAAAAVAEPTAAIRVETNFFLLEQSPLLHQYPSDKV